MPFTIYKLIHLLGILMIVLSFGGIIMYAINGGKKQDNTFRKQAAITHGIGMFLALLGGFGMLARLGIHWPWPGWIVLKILIWIIFGGLITVVYRKPELGRWLWLSVLLLGTASAYLALMKPF